MLKKKAFESRSFRGLIVVFFVITNSVQSQILFSPEVIQSHQSQFRSESFQPTQIHVGASGHRYYLDEDSRRMAVISPQERVQFSGGFGTDYDALFDPIGMASSQLQVWVSDRSQNRLLVFDYNLNFIQSIKHDRVYPNLIAVDPWGNILLYSEQERSIWIVSDRSFDTQPFIDLHTDPDFQTCIRALAVNPDGEVGLMNPCKMQVKVYNRLGQDLRNYGISIPEPEFFLSIQDRWVVFNQQGAGEILGQDRAVEIPLQEPVIDMDTEGERLYCLTESGTWVFNTRIIETEEEEE